MPTNNLIRNVRGEATNCFAFVSGGTILTNKCDVLVDWYNSKQARDRCGGCPFFKAVSKDSKIKRMPKNGDTYYYINRSGNVSCRKWSSREIDKKHLAENNVYKTYAEAKQQNRDREVVS